MTYWALRVDLTPPGEDAQPAHEWAIGRMVGDRMRVWLRTPSLMMALPSIARVHAAHQELTTYRAP